MKELEYPFDSAEIRRKSKKLKRELLKQENHISKRIAVLSGSTIGQLNIMLELFLLNQGISPVIQEGAYNNYYEEAVFEYDKLKEFAPDIIYVHTSVRNIQEWPEAADSAEEVENKIDRLVGKFVRIWDTLQENIGCPVIQNNFEMLPYRVMGNMDRVHVTGRQYFIEEVNRKLVSEIQKRKDVFLNDIHYLSAGYGLERWFDDSAWYAFKYAFSPDAIVQVAYNIANVIKSYFGKNKKAIVVDLDNTLWKGVIGDDGVEGIGLGIETPEGMMYREFQEYLKSIKDRGILLNICSKNEDGAAQMGLNHPSSALQPEDFTIITCNWDRKSENIRNMSQRLNLNTDSFVFIDDNPAEQEEVNANVDGIIVLPVSDTSEMRKLLDQAGYFEITNYSQEDLARNSLYKANLERESISDLGDYNDYLLSLDMRVEFAQINAENIDRVTQLINKTNQFNLTGLRLGKSEVEAFSKQHISICGTLVDKFGNNGLVSVILGEITGESEVNITVWIMSCRVFKRNLEFAMFDRLVEECRKRGLSKITGKYIATNKNMPVADLYKDLQFVQNEEGTWEYIIPTPYEKQNQVIQVTEEV